MPSKHLIAALLRAHHTLAPSSMHVGPIAHHWTGTQVEVLMLAAVLVAGFLIIRSLLGRSNSN